MTQNNKLHSNLLVTCIATFPPTKNVRTADRVELELVKSHPAKPYIKLHASFFKNMKQESFYSNTVHVRI